MAGWGQEMTQESKFNTREYGLFNWFSLLYFINCTIVLFTFLFFSPLHLIMLHSRQSLGCYWFSHIVMEMNHGMHLWKMHTSNYLFTVGQQYCEALFASTDFQNNAQFKNKYRVNNCQLKAKLNNVKKQIREWRLKYKMLIMVNLLLPCGMKSILSYTSCLETIA